MATYRQPAAPLCWDDDLDGIREDGFYWVRLDDNEPEVACWQRQEWWFCGDDRSWRFGAVQVLSDRLTLAPGLRMVS